MLEDLLLELSEDKRKCIENPQFGTGGRIHNWRRYVPDDIMFKWFELSVETRIAVLYMANIQASNEEYD